MFYRTAELRDHDPVYVFHALSLGYSDSDVEIERERDIQREIVS